MMTCDKMLYNYQSIYRKKKHLPDVNLTFKITEISNL